MNKNKISSALINKVSAMSVDDNEKYDVILTCINFNKTKNLLDNYGFKYNTYRFANCFGLKLDNEDLNFLSNLDDIKFVYENSYVKAERLEQDVMNLHKLTEGKFLGQGQTICFIDTGIYPHVDFLFPHSRLIKFIDLVNHNNTAYDDNGHGTFVAGIACGNDSLNSGFMGFAPKANIISIKALGKNGNSDSNKILDAMQWVYENHKALNIKVVCMSFGADVVDNNDPLSLGAQALWNAGITVVVAAGNSGPENKTIKSPGNNPYVITVGAYDVSKNVIADFSSRGPTIYGHKPDLVAPAVDITSCNNGLPFSTTMSGTSVAAPIVAGICADILSRYPKATNNQIKAFLLANCTKITGDIDKEGAGYLNFKNL